MIAINAQAVAAGASFLSNAVPFSNGRERAVLVTVKPTNTVINYTVQLYVSVDGVDYFLMMAGGPNVSTGNVSNLFTTINSYRSIVYDISGARYLKINITNNDGATTNTFTVSVWPTQTVQ